MSTTIDLNLSFSEIRRALRQPLKNSTVAYRGSAMGVDSATGRVRPLVPGDDFAGFTSARADNRTFSTGADPLLAQLVVEGLVELTIAGVVATSLGATVYATDENTFTLTAGGSTIGTVQQFVSAGVAVVAFSAFAVAGASSSGGSSGGGSGGGGGSDIDSLTLVASGAAEGQPDEFQDAFSWAASYDGSGDPTGYTIEGTTIATAVTAVGDFWRVTGAVKYTSGALILTAVEAAALQTAAIGATTSIRHGARILVTSTSSAFIAGAYIWDSGNTLFVPEAVPRLTLAQRDAWVATSPTLVAGQKIFVTDVGSIIDDGGVTRVPGGEQVWCAGIGFLWTRPVVYADMRMSTGISGGPNTLRTLVSPASVAGPYSRAHISGFIEFSAGAATKDITVTINGNTVYLVAGIAAGTRMFGVSKSMYGYGPSKQKLGATSGVTDAGAPGTAAYRDLTINCATTALTVTFVTTTTGDLASITRASLSIVDDLIGLET
jgi:hypothetical protein